MEVNIWLAVCIGITVGSVVAILLTHSIKKEYERQIWWASRAMSICESLEDRLRREILDHKEASQIAIQSFVEERVNGDVPSQDKVGTTSDETSEDTGKDV